VTDVFHSQFTGCREQMMVIPLPLVDTAQRRTFANHNGADVVAILSVKRHCPSTSQHFIVWVGCNDKNAVFLLRIHEQVRGNDGRRHRFLQAGFCTIDDRYYRYCILAGNPPPCRNSPSNLNKPK
jgi:hypothetical protein